MAVRTLLPETLRQEKYIEGVADKLNRRLHSPVWLYFIIATV